eukprot:1544757-Pyramimonas_sp.AAC.1
MCTAPSDGGMRPVSIAMVVVLPAPLCPRKPVISPSRISRSSPDTATFECVPVTDPSDARSVSLFS